MNTHILQQFIENTAQNKCNLIAASKTRTKKEIIDAKNAGISHFGENYIQEAVDKVDSFKGASLHLIGHLQSNKCKEAVKYFDYIHSVDRIKLAKHLELECVKQARAQIKIFIQVNQANEISKGGVLKTDLSTLILYIVEKCPHLKLLGLMAIPPKHEDSSTYFAELKNLAQEYNLKELSMGMSNDYDDAIKNGATYIRVGRAIFGPKE